MTLTVFSACEEKVSYELSLDGALYPGAEIPLFLVSAAGEETSLGEGFEIVVSSGAEVASVSDGVLFIAKTASAGDAFTLSVTGGGVSLTEDFVVAALGAEKITLLAADEAAAGEEIRLKARILPDANLPVTYELIRGNATLEGDLLRIGRDADYGEYVVVSARCGDVVSAEKYIKVTTYQPHSLTITAEEDACPAGESLFVRVDMAPDYTDFPLYITFETGGEYATYDRESSLLTVSREAPEGASILLVASCGTKVVWKNIRVGRPVPRAIAVADGGSAVTTGETRTFTYALTPANADDSEVEVFLLSGGNYIEWETGSTTFKVKETAPRGSEIVFRVSASVLAEDVTVRYTVETVQSASLAISTTANASSYLGEGEEARISAEVSPADWAGDVRYNVLDGADLVEEVTSGVFVVKAGAGRGVVRISAVTSDGVGSNEVSFSVRGRYDRRVYEDWSQVSFKTSKEAHFIWMVLPEDYDVPSEKSTILVPYEVTDLILEGHYDGTEATVYQGLYFYFRNAATRTVTLSSFATAATYGMGGTVMDFGSSGKTTVVLDGANLVRADSPYYLDNDGEKVNGVWQRKTNPSNKEIKQRNGMYGHNGVNGGIALGGYSLVFKGDGVLLAEAGNGTDGTNGGDGASAAYTDGVLLYVSGSGGDGGNGGDSGSAIYAYRVEFESGMVTAVAGKAGVKGLGGEAGGISALAGLSVTATRGENGADGENGVVYLAVNAKEILGTSYVTAQGSVENRKVRATDSLDALIARMEGYCGVSVYYKAIEDPYASYPMEKQTDASATMKQAQFLLYTFEMMPKNCWREFVFLNNGEIKIYLVKRINSGRTLGLTDATNRVWFATFETEMRGVIRGGYYNIMLHEFTHVLTYNMTTTKQNAFKKNLANVNKGGPGYASTSNDGVYGVWDENTAQTSYFLTGYSRTDYKEDAAETLSLCSVFVSRPDFLEEGTHIREKFELIVNTFAGSFETMSRFKDSNSFAYDHLFEEREKAAA